jgi:pyruvate kinase
MLSAETAIGKYPTQAVRTMASIAEYTEPEIDREAIFRELTRSRSKIDSTEAVAAAVAQLVASVSPRAVVTSSSSGQTPRLVSRFRLKPHVLCTTWNPKTQNQLAIVYGVEAVFMPLPLDTEAVIINSIQAFRQARRLKRGDSVVITAGVPPGKPGSTNLILNYNVR